MRYVDLGSLLGLGVGALLVCTAATLTSLVRRDLATAARRGAQVLLVAAVVIEVAQHAAGRAADVDDVLLNTAGALFGAALAVLGARLLDRRRTGAPPTEDLHPSSPTAREV